MRTIEHAMPLPAALTGTRDDLSAEARARVRALMGARPMAFLRELILAWAVIVGAVVAAEYIDSWWATGLAILIVATRQNVLGLLVHEQAHHLGFASRWGDLFVNLTAAYPLIVLRVGDYAQVHLMHHKHFFKEEDPDFLRKSGEDWVFPMTRSHLLGLFARDLFGLNFIRTFKGKKMQGGRATPFKRRMVISGWVHGAWLAVAAGVLIATGAWDIALLYWVLPLLTVFQVIVRWGALCEHKYNLRDAALEGSTPVITLSWWEKLLLPNLNFHLHLYHHYFANVSFSNLPKLHDIFVEEDLVNEWNIHRGYAAFFRALTMTPEKAADRVVDYGEKTSASPGR